MTLFIEGILIYRAQALFSLWALFGATGINSYTRMVSLIRPTSVVRASSDLEPLTFPRFMEANDMHSPTARKKQSLQYYDSHYGIKAQNIDCFKAMCKSLLISQSFIKLNYIIHCKCYL